VALPLSLILLVILFSQAYINFDGNRVIADRMEKAGQEAFVLSKEISLDGINKNARRYPAVVTQADMEAFMSTGFEGKTYPILSISVPVTSYKNASGIKSTYFSFGVAATESLGTVIVDEQFMIDKLGAFELAARERNQDPIGVYITDYLADMILANNSNYKGKSYNSLLGYYSPDDSGIGEIYINGIIRTNYEERYKELIDRVTVNKDNDLATLYNDEQFQKLSSELYSFLGYSYTFNQNYVEDYLSEEIAEYHFYAWSHKLIFDGKTEYNVPKGYVLYDYEAELADGQIVMGHKTYNAIFGTSYAPETLDTFTPHKAQMAQYAYYDTDNENPWFDTEVEIAGLYNGEGIEVSYGVRSLFDQNHIRQTGIYFDGLSHLSDILDMAEERSFIQDSITLEGILTLHRCVMLFVAIFRLVNIVLCAAVVFIFISFSTKMIQDKLHEIGILKALGTDRLTINIIFGLQIGLIALFTCVVSSLGYLLLVEPANELFIISLREMVPSQLVLDLDVLVYIPRLVWENALLVAILAIVSLVVPMAKIGRIQPVKIINNRD
jgi:ABC-type antimicrobial peptide transport system permease subunit